MFAEIVRVTDECAYDFRSTANPQDPLNHLFAEWVPYYRLKWAIARHLQPRTILEIGVRFGYSALAFLSACPESEYLGIDNDSETFGGNVGALDWARQALTPFRARVLLADSQQMDAFPGGRFDLIHIDGQQDEAGLHHDLAIALRQGEYVLVDGVFWTRTNFLSNAEFLLRYRDDIEYCGIIPGYAGDLLIRPKTQAREASARLASSSGELHMAYNPCYYLNDCGRFNTLKKAGGAIMADSRLRAMIALAECVSVGRALDLGCGSGEMTLALTTMGHQVTGLDSSADAIAIAQQAAARAGVPADRLQFFCQGVTAFSLSGRYDVVTAADLIEHLSPAELDHLYGDIAAHLAPGGLFAVHTFPNKWFYQYEHPRRIRAANALGAYLPANPRTRYEQKMHINEQSPRLLLKQLRRHFPFVLLWFAQHDYAKPFENLERPYGRAAMRAAADLFAVASLAPIRAADLSEALRMPPLPENQASAINLRIFEAPTHVATGAIFEVAVSITNGSSHRLAANPPCPVNLSYHWLEPDGHMLAFEGRRTGLVPGVSPDATRTCTMRVAAPQIPGIAILRATLVQEHVRWFDSAQIRCFADAPIELV